MTAPTLHTERLSLRMPKHSHFEHWAAFIASERSVQEHGPLARADGSIVRAADASIGHETGALA